MSRKGKRVKKSKKIITSIITIIILLILAILGINEDVLNTFSKINLNNYENNISQNNTNQSNQTQEIAKSNIILNKNLDIYFIDVGQADSILLTNNSESMLIDAGNNEDGENVVNFIKEKGITKLNYVIGTHPHEDHIGGLDNVINNFEIEKIYMPKIETTTKTFEDVIDAINNKNLKISNPKKGETFNLADATCQIMLDPILDKDNLNLSSIVLKVQYGNNSFLFMGDAEEENEKTIDWPKVDVLKVGHHGSNTSTSEDFLNQVSPKYAVISAGENNSYGLPKQEIIDRLQKINTKIYRTDKDGTIKMSSDGNEITIEKEK